MKIYVISDTHTKHEFLRIPSDIDMIIHAGDFTNSNNTHQNMIEASIFLNWYESLDVKYKLLCCGNHDVAVERSAIDPRNYGITYLQHESVVIEGIKFFGSPYTPSFGNWAFNKKRGRLKEVWDTIDDDTNVLITHGPSFGILDLCIDMDVSKTAVKQVGCKSLLKRVKSLKKLTHHIFGHLHDEVNHNNYGMLQQDGLTYINAAVYSHRHPSWLNPGHLIDI